MTATVHMRASWRAATALMAACLVLFALSVRAQQAPPEPRFEVDQYVVEGESPISQEEVNRILAPYTGEHQGIAGLQEAASSLEEELVRRGFSFYRVVLPAQTLKDKRVRLAIVAFKVGQISVEGNEHFSDENILRSLPALKQGETPRTNAISRQRLLANEHPSKRVEVRFQESEAQQAIDASVLVEDTSPFSVFLQFNNRGTDDSGDLRLTAGGQYSNLFNLDHIVTGSYTRSPDDWSAVEQWGVNYQIPFYSLGGTLAGYYVSSSVDSGTVAESFDVSGAGTFFGFNYTQILGRLGGYTHRLSIGIDDKLFEDESLFNLIPIGVDVRSVPFSVGYTGRYESTAGSLGFYLAYLRNIETGSDNDSANYTAVRFGAKPSWDKFLLGGSFDYRLPQAWLLRGRSDIQLTDEPLIPGEQFGLGGALSVRGYEEREVSRDVGLFASLEVWTRPLVYDVRGIAFFDIGLGRNKDEVIPELDQMFHLSSVGAGLRWFFKTNLSVDADVAVALHDAVTTKQGDVSFLFNVLARF